MKRNSLSFFSGLIFFIFINNFILHEVFIRQKQNFNISNEDESTTNIIFTETNSTRDVMNFKELCAIESAAKHNPESTVLVFSINSIINDTQLLEKYKNIKNIILNLNETFNNTILHNFWFENKLSTAKYPIFRVSHLSDALRFLFIYKYGGIYSDLDTITIKDMSYLRKFNGIGSLYKPEDVQAGVLHFTKEHPFILRCLKRFAKEYNGKIWAANGPLLISKEIGLYCNQTNFTSLLFFGNNEKKCDVGIFPYYYFYPYHWNEWKVLFEKNAKLVVSKFINTFSVHFYGKMSTNIEMKANENSLFEYFASINCPLAYSKHILNNKSQY